MKRPHIQCLTVGAGDGGAAGSAARLDISQQPRAHINDSGAGSVDGVAVLGGLGGGELDGAVVGEADERAALLEVLDNPLGVVLAQRVRLGGERADHHNTISKAGIL